jgi:hypothetical protein
MSTPGRWWVGRWLTISARSSWSTLWRWHSGDANPQRGWFTIPTGVCNTPRCRSASGSKKQVLYPLWAGRDRRWITPSLRELCGELGVRAALRASLPQPGGSQDSDLRLHRRVLQPGEASLVVGLLESRRLRASYNRGNRGGCGGVRKNCPPPRGNASPRYPLIAANLFLRSHWRVRPKRNSCYNHDKSREGRGQAPQMMREDR